MLLSENNAQQQQQQQDSSTGKPSSELIKTDGDDAHEPLFSTETSSAAAAGATATTYAQLAWVLHGHIPLLCCRTDDLNEAAGYLGSLLDQQQQQSQNDSSTFNNNDNVQHAENEDVDVENFMMAQNGANRNGHQPEQQQVNGNHAANGHENNNDNNNNNAEVDSLAEVFAAESDDSDFEFESDWNPNDQVASLNQWVAAVEEAWDPIQLSKPNLISGSSLTWNAVAATVTALLQSFSYSQVAALTTQQWKALRISDLLTQLILALLVPPASQASPMLTAESCSEDHWRRLGLHVLHVFRDFTWHQLTVGTTTKVTTSTTTLLEDYLRLLRILMQATTDQKNTNVKTTEPAMLVGLSSLSSLCSDILAHSKLVQEQRTNVHFTCSPVVIVQTLQSSVVEACDDLTDLLEASSEKSADDVLALQWTYVSLFQILATPSTNTAAAGVLDGAGSVGTMPTAHAQTLLNSGLFRQWLLLWKTRTTDEACRSVVQSSILDLCVASPTLLGKYAWRFPDLAEQVVVTSVPEVAPLSDPTQAAVGDRSLLHDFLWNLLAIHLADSSHQSSGSLSAPKVQWKSSESKEATTETAARVIITAESCQQAAWSLFQSMCQTALKILTDWKLRRENNLEELSAVVPGGSSRVAKQKNVLDDFGRLSTRLAVPLLHTLFVDKMVPTTADATTGSPEKIRAELQPIQRILSQWPSATQSSSSARKSDLEDDSDDDGEKEAVKRMSPEKKLSQSLEKEETINALRKSIKTIISALETDGQQAKKGFRQQSFSSKAD